MIILIEERGKRLGFNQHFSKLDSKPIQGNREKKQQSVSNVIPLLFCVSNKITRQEHIIEKL